MVTPDAERTMNTYLGASSLLAISDVDEVAVAEGRVLYMEGYLYDRPEAKLAFRHAARIVNILPRAARALAVHRRAVIVQLQRDADDIVPLFVQQGGRDGRIHPARHGHHHAGFVWGFREAHGIDRFSCHSR